MNVRPVVIGFALGMVQVAASAAPVDYLREVKPILVARCTSCHGAIRQKAGLRLDTAEFIRRGGDGGPAVEPGKSAESLILERVTASDSAERMPPESEGVPLTAVEVESLRAWIDQGAKAPPEPTPADPRKHWAYLPPVRPIVPRPSDPEWAINPIDAFLDAGYQARGLRPSPPLADDLWLRRVSLDLVGLPPTREQRQAFLADRSANAADRVVNRLLADARHGERWGRHWMDIWRYSDWYGLGEEIRYSHPHIWQWRDWIVGSLNSDKGYDRMVEEMLAGDELAPDDPGTLRATGFLARNWNIFNRNAWLDSTVEHTARAFLGVTIQCARCHDHKFDPVSQAEYYRLRAFFEPHHIRIDRVPGQRDRTKAGLPRAFDDFLEHPTYLFVRGDEATPDKSRPLQPATPRVLGGEIKIVPVALPPEAANPDKREFVIREALEDAQVRVTKARTEAADAEKQAGLASQALAAANESDRLAEAQVNATADKPAEFKSALAAAARVFETLARAERAARDAEVDLEIARSTLALAEAKEAALKAVLNVEALEDQGAKLNGSEAWAGPARDASAAQRQCAVLEAKTDRLIAARDHNRARRALDGVLKDGQAPKVDPDQAARAKAAGDLVEARRRVSVAVGQLAKAETARNAPATTEYTPRPLEFPRAKLTFRDTPSTAPYSKISTGRRLALARWLVDRRNPLTARVAVNHVWTHHFGEPLVGSLDDFGLRTPQPESHELLDWLAVEFIDSGWSFKHLHRLIVSSRAYRMRSSDAGPSDPNLAIDPDNRYVWRMNAQRMEGEVVRDSVLFLTGHLDSRIGGPDLPVASAETGTRRTLYYRYASGENIPFLSIFDAASVTDCYRRAATIVPQQALALSNSGMILKRAGDISSVIDREVGAEPEVRDAFIDSAYERLLGRSPTVAERAECASGLARLATAFAAEGTQSGPPESRARSALVHVLLNHNDFVTIR